MVPQEGERRLKAAVYARLSREGEDGLSLEGQVERCEAYVLSRGWDLVATFEDNGVSGGRADRPGLEKLLEAVRRRQAQVVVVNKIDRLSRSLLDLLTFLRLFERSRVAFVSVSESFDSSTPVGKMLLQILGSFAEFERSRIGERMKESSAKRKASGKVYGQVPYGLEPGPDGRTLVAVPMQMTTVRQVFTWRGMGWTLRKIAEELNRRGVTTKQGKTWKAEQIRSVLLNRDLYARFLEESR